MGTTKRRGAGWARFQAAKPLAEFPEEHRLDLEWAAAQPRAPKRWVTVCDGLAQVESRAWYEWHWARGNYPGGDGDTSRPSLRPHIRQAVMERDGLTCGLCGGDVVLEDVHIDHILPWSRGGSSELDNLQVAHSACNIAKGNRI